MYLIYVYSKLFCFYFHVLLIVVISFFDFEYVLM